MPAIPPTDILEVMRHVPHRYPFVLVDRVDGGESGEWLRATKHVSMDAPYFVATSGDSAPVMPPRLIVEALAQAGGILCFFSGLLKPRGGSTTFLAAVDHTRFVRDTHAGETLTLDCRLKRALRGVIRIEGRAAVGDDTVVETVLTMVVRDTEPELAAHDPRNAP